MHRRAFLATVPALALLPRPASRPDAGQLRIDGTPAQAAALQARTAIPTTATTRRGRALVDALNAGHLEAATLDPDTLAHAVTLMGSRLDIIGGTGRATIVSRTVLPRALREDLAAALA